MKVVPDFFLTRCTAEGAETEAILRDDVHCAKPNPFTTSHLVNCTVQVYGVGNKTRCTRRGF